MGYVLDEVGDGVLLMIVLVVTFIVNLSTLYSNYLTCNPNSIFSCSSKATFSS